MELKEVLRRARGKPFEMERVIERVIDAIESLEARVAVLEAGKSTKGKKGRGK